MFFPFHSFASIFLKLTFRFLSEGKNVMICFPSFHLLKLSLSYFSYRCILRRIKPIFQASLSFFRLNRSLSQLVDLRQFILLKITSEPWIECSDRNDSIVTLILPMHQGTGNIGSPHSLTIWSPSNLCNQTNSKL